MAKRRGPPLAFSTYRSTAERQCSILFSRSTKSRIRSAPFRRNVRMTCCSLYERKSTDTFLGRSMWSTKLLKSSVLPTSTVRLSIARKASFTMKCLLAAVGSHHCRSSSQVLAKSGQPRAPSGLCSAFGWHSSETLTLKLVQNISLSRSIDLLI